MSKTKNNAIFRCNPMIASLHKRAADDLDHTLAVHLGYEWHTALLAMMDAGIGESVSIRYAANCLGAWLDHEQPVDQNSTLPITPRPTREQIMPVCGGIYPGYNERQQ